VRNDKDELAAYSEAVEYVCVHARTLRDKIDPGVWSGAIGVIGDAAATGDAWRAAVRRLHEAAESAKIPRGIGLPELRGAGSGFPAEPMPRATGWVCPSGRCSRVEVRGDASAATPDCAVFGRPMRLVD
jgi:hypothetical protein